MPCSALFCFSGRAAISCGVPYRFDAAMISRSAGTPRPSKKAFPAFAIGEGSAGFGDAGAFWANQSPDAGGGIAAAFGAFSANQSAIGFYGMTTAPFDL